MAFAIIQRGIFWPKVIYLGITRRKPPAHLTNASLAFFCCSSSSRCRGNGSRAHFIVFFVK